MIRALLALSLAATPLDAADARELVDGVAAVVGRRVITLTEVDTEGRMVLVNRAGAKGLEQPIDDEFRRSVLDYLVVQELLVQEGRRLHGVGVSEAEVDQGVAAFRARFGDEARFSSFLAELGVDEEAVRTIVRRDLTVRALLARVLDAGPPVVDDEVRHYLEAHPEMLPGASDGVRVAAAREALSLTRREGRFAAYVADLKRSTDVRLVAGFARAERAQ